LAPVGATACDRGVSVGQKECDAASQELLSEMGKTAKRRIAVGSVGGQGCKKRRFNRCSWNCVPKGCSVMSGGDWTPHFKIGTHSCNPAHLYRIVCYDPPDLLQDDAVSVKAVAATLAPVKQPVAQQGRRRRRNR
jgi:hypothetical protein